MFSEGNQKTAGLCSKAEPDKLFHYFIITTTNTYTMDIFPQLKGLWKYNLWTGEIEICLFKLYLVLVRVFSVMNDHTLFFACKSLCRHQVPSKMGCQPSDCRLTLKSSSSNSVFLWQRWANLHHAWMRIGCTGLNYDLYTNLHVIKSPSCRYSAIQETAYHYFKECILYDDQYFKI